MSPPTSPLKEHRNPSLSEVIPPRRNISEKYFEEIPAVLLENTRSMFGEHVSLKWVSWSLYDSGVPNGAVNIWNDYTSRRDYVCKYGCSSGFYAGGSCHYSLSGKEHYATYFDILVNEDNFEVINWASDSWGDVPSNSIAGCLSSSYVGKNSYGLGKVVPQHSAFFLPYNGYEYDYRYYDVLYINKQGYSQRVYNVQYKKNQIQVLQETAETLKFSKVDNYACQTVTKTVKLQISSTTTKSWDIGRSTTSGLSTTITAGIPYITTEVGFSTEKTFSVNSGMSTSQTVDHEVSLEVVIPPNESCTVKMVGSKMKVDIPYTATLSRTYNSAGTRYTTITGLYKGVEVGGIRAVVERCIPIPNANPCKGA